MADARTIMLICAFFGALSLLALYLGVTEGVIISNLIVLGLSGYGALRSGREK